MERYLSPVLFGADFSSDSALTSQAYAVRTAREVGFKERWLQEAISRDPELVIAPCREAELTDESWVFWARELPVGPGPIDIVLLSESGRVAIVETKLSYNPEGRRTVLAQLLEYAVSLPTVEGSRLPPVPHVDGQPFIDTETLHSRIQEGDYLLVVAGDRLDSRAVNLSKSLLGRHLVHGWDLALVEVAVFEASDSSRSPRHLLVPHLRGAIVPEQRQVVRVIVEGDHTRVEVAPASPVAVNSSQQQKQSEELFFAALESPAVPPPYRRFGADLRALRDRHDDITFRFGRGDRPTLILRTNDASLLEFSPDGTVRFRRNFFPAALGEAGAVSYLKRLEELFPAALKMAYPQVRLTHESAQVTLPQLLAVVEQELIARDTRTSE